MKPVRPNLSIRRPALLVLGGVLALSACGGPDESAEDGSRAYRVGVPIVQSGPAAFAGVPVANGIELAVREINESSFLGGSAEVEVDIVDTAGDPAAAIAAFKQFESDGVAGVLCCTLGGEAGALAPLLKESPVSGIVTVSILAGLADPPHLFRPFEVPSTEGGTYDEFFDAVLAGGDFEDAVMVVNNDNDAMVQDSKIYAAALERNDVEMRDELAVAITDTSFTGVATQIVDTDPDLVVASTIGTSTAGLARALRDRGYDKPILSNVGADSRSAFETSAGGMAGTIFPTPYHSEFGSNDLARDFATAYADAFGSPPDAFAAQGYTAMWLMATGIRDVGTGDPTEVGAALSRIAQQDSVYGTIDFDDGQADIASPALHLVWNEDGTVSEWSP